MVKDEKVTRGMIRRASEGKIISRIPFGYIYRNGEITVIPEESDVIKKIYELYFDGKMGYSDIANFLNSQGLLKRGKSWERYAVKRVVRNRMYYGKVNINGQEFSGDFPAILDHEYVEKGGV